MKNISAGVAHKVPEDLRRLLTSSEKLVDLWNALTPLGRNEWICWTISVKKDETRAKHIQRLGAEVVQGKRRPCCWAGCPHR